MDWIPNSPSYKPHADNAIKGKMKHFILDREMKHIKPYLLQLIDGLKLVHIFCWHWNLTSHQITGGLHYYWFVIELKPLDVDRLSKAFIPHTCVSREALQISKFSPLQIDRLYFQCSIDLIDHYRLNGNKVRDQHVNINTLKGKQFEIW